MASPKHAPTVTLATETSRPHTSAIACIQTGFLVPPPTSIMRPIGSPCSRSIMSTWDATVYATPSKAARTIWARVCLPVRPKKTPRASGSLSGVRSPAKYGRHRSPSAPGATSAASCAMTEYASGPPWPSASTASRYSSWRSHDVSAPAVLVPAQIP